MNNPYLPETYKILNIVKETDIDWTFKVEFNKDVIGGQFVQISLPGVGEAPISISGFDDKSIDLTIRKVGKLTDQIFNANVGDSVYMRGPYGNGFNPEIFKGKDLAFITGGTGLAPVKSTINYFVENSDEVDNLEIMCGFKSSKDTLFNDTLDGWNEKANLFVTIDKPEENWNKLDGLITTHIDKLDLKKAEEKVVIVVGPPIMMKFTTLELIKHGIKKENIWVSFERKMSCGIGKCGHCKIDETYVCLEGPVFNYVKAQELLD